MHLFGIYPGVRITWLLLPLLASSLSNPTPTRHSLDPEPYKLNPEPFASLQVVEEVLEKHASLTPLLRTVEEMVCGTATGRAPACAKFFAHWEAGLHQALHDMILQVPHLLLALLVHVITAAPDPSHWQAGLHHAASFLLSLQHGMVAVHLLQAPTPASSWCCARQQSAGPLWAASSLFKGCLPPSSSNPQDAGPGLPAGMLPTSR